MNVSRESPVETEQRLFRLARSATLEVQDGDWWFEEFSAAELSARLRPDAVALVRDGDRWSQLVPERGGDRAVEPMRLWSFHFPPDWDNSGFVGWLATRLKARTGSGVIVVCGRNDASGGIFDYWGCPVAAAPAVMGEILALRSGPAEKPTLDGISMRAVATGAGGQVDRNTLFSFSQEGGTVWAHYAGGAVEVGYLAGRLTDGRLVFRYCQVDRQGEVHGGRSVCDLEVLPDGRLRLVEHFQWESRSENGTNVLEQVTR
jgi:hypothetical protein